jgi:hypothetical protein
VRNAIIAMPPPQGGKKERMRKKKVLETFHIRILIYVSNVFTHTLLGVLEALYACFDPHATVIYFSVYIVQYVLLQFVTYDVCFYGAVH